MPQPGQRPATEPPSLPAGPEALPGRLPAGRAAGGQTWAGSWQAQGSQRRLLWRPRGSLSPPPPASASSWDADPPSTGQAGRRRLSRARPSSS